MAAEPDPLDVVVRARRAIIDGAEVSACVGVTGERITSVTSYDEVPAAARTVTLEDDEVLLPGLVDTHVHVNDCLLYTSPSPRDGLLSRMPSSA